MISKKTVFCEMAFWDKFSGSASSLRFSPDTTVLQNLKTWTDLYSFICRSFIRFDCSESDFIRRVETDENLRYLWKKCTDGKCSMEFGGRFDNRDALMRRNPLSVFLAKDDIIRRASLCGIISIMPDQYLDSLPLFQDNGVPLTEGEYWDWECLKQLVPKKAANSMVIVDNYVLKNEKCNLYRILDSLLPKTSAQRFDITIFHLLVEDRGISREQAERNAMDREKKLREHLLKIRNSLEINLEFVRMRKEDNFVFHDRSIITNNYYISSGAGFDLLESAGAHFKLKQSTTLQIIYPYFASGTNLWIDARYEGLISDAKRALSNNGLVTNNRLLQ